MTDDIKIIWNGKPGRFVPDPEPELLLPAGTRVVMYGTIMAYDNQEPVYEIVIDGVDEKSVAAAMAAGVKAAAMVPGVKFISAGNFGGTLGPYKIELHKIL